MGRKLPSLWTSGDLLAGSSVGMPAQNSTGATVSLKKMDLRLMPYTLDDDDEGEATGRTRTDGR